MTVPQTLNIKCKEFQLILPMIAMEINLIITMIYLQLKTRIMHYGNFSKPIFDSNQQFKTDRHSSFVE